jgi:NAD(P)-dependent dehydrogenase (short-subunit alcohol dehydrogenase family)
MVMSRRSDDRRVALVTGANRGIGLAVCRQLAERGVVVLLGARDAAAGDAAARTLQADGLEVRPIVIDTDHRETFDAAREAIEREFGKLDILVNNIGIGCDWAYTAANVPMPLLRNTFEINFFSVVELTQRLLPLVRKSPAAASTKSSATALAGHATPESWRWVIVPGPTAPARPRSTRLRFIWLARSGYADQGQRRPSGHRQDRPQSERAHHSGRGGADLGGTGAATRRWTNGWILPPGRGRALVMVLACRRHQWPMFTP